MSAPNIYDIILCLFSEDEGEFRGKTNVHKNLYLIREMLKKKKVEVPYTYKPYFYGPYSADISNALDLMEDSGLISSREEKFPGKGNLENRLAIYSLQDSGRSAAAKARENYPDFFSLFDGSFSKIRKSGSYNRTPVMATASKISFILGREGKPMTVAAIKKQAKELTWELSDIDIESAVGVLEGAELVSSSNKEK
ncbi:MAG: hypothetical protein KAT79_00635 [candidate division Zixibacteria bacterium]|nr:hypothetical protein [candidate division Zixibacteria bacterium]